MSDPEPIQASADAGPAVPSVMATGVGSTFKIQAWGWYGGLGSWDNRIRSIQTWPCDSGV
ncbi:hypothetical protein [Streptomyces aquilus]|uniref:hypothetical protein n=1 Tax=Streptomyces aquilus TaxID=2548456 RepID=UPI00368D0A8F